MQLTDVVLGGFFTVGDGTGDYTPIATNTSVTKGGYADTWRGRTLLVHRSRAVKN